MDTEAPFPHDVEMRIDHFVTRWAVVVWSMSTDYSSDDQIVMVRYFKTRRDALSFRYSH